MSDTRLRALVALTGLALVGVIAAGAVLGSKSAADDLQPKAEHALSTAGLDRVEVAFEGREAVLRGAGDLDRAEQVVEDVDGVRWATVDFERGASSAGPATPSTAPTIALRRTVTGVTISGAVPDADSAAEIKARAAETLDVRVTGDLTIDPALASGPWLTELPNAFGDLVGVKGLRLDIDGQDTIRLGGSIESEAGVARIRELVTRAFPDLTVLNGVKVAAGALSEADAAVLNSATLYFGRGRASLDPGLERTLDVVAEVLARNQAIVIEAGGHAGPNDPVKGQRLSAARVAAVRAYLVRAGVQAGRVRTKSYGSDQPSIADPAARQYRRVDFVVKGN